MRINLFEICRVGSKDASKYITANQNQGFVILEAMGKYWSYTVTEYAFGNAEFATGFDGLYIFDLKKVN